jgi:hypothetical protein
MYGQGWIIPWSGHLSKFWQWIRENGHWNPVYRSGFFSMRGDTEKFEKKS